MTSSQPAALVTGATSGIGRATAYKLVNDGWTVFAAGRRTENLDTLVQECQQLSGTLIPVATDVTDEASIDALYETVQRHGGLDTVLNIAGGAMGSESVAEAHLADWQWMIETNITGSMRVTQTLRHMLRYPGEVAIFTIHTDEGDS